MPSAELWALAINAPIKYTARWTMSIMASDFIPSGRRRAVIIGIEYKDTSYALTRSAPDLRRVGGFLRNELGVEPRNMLMLSDFEFDQHDVRHQQPTRYNILNAMRWLSYGAQSGDLLFLYYAGQGAQVQGESGDEIDSRDETIVPADFKQAGLILDDEIHRVLVGPLPAQVIFILSHFPWPNEY